MQRRDRLSSVSLETESDCALARQCALGDSGALAILYTRHGTMVFQAALRLTGSTADAEDVLQDVFVGLGRAAQSFRGDGPFAAWLRRIAVNQTLLGFRRRRPDAEPWPDAAAGPDSSIDIRLDLLQALARLSPRQRQVLVLHDVEGFSHHEIAAATGLSPGASATCLHRARRIAARFLSEDR
jgi:RNA polymerase sigma factor (sigma-70 family)